MLTTEQIQEIKEHLNRAQNPLFFFDNDNDGLASFLLLRRFIDRGKGVVIKSFPDLNVSYYRKVDELKPDYIFILDKPAVSNEFLEKARQENIPVVWIDHHDTKPLNIENPLLSYYNPSVKKNGDEPVSYLVYKILNNKEDVWIALVGCISDCFLPDFYETFKKQYPELAKNNPESAFDLLYNSEIGKIARILDFSLKDTTTNVVKMMKFMMNAKGPTDILEENHKTKQILTRYNQINEKYQELIKKARMKKAKKIIYFQYGGGLSLSSNLANQLSYEFPNKIVVVVYINEDIANISIRGPKNIHELTMKAIEGIEGATGGGHEHATGAKMNVSGLGKFKGRIEKLVE